MPLFEFRCENSYPQELLLSMAAADHSAPCPECGGAAIRLISSPALGHLSSERAQLLDRAESSARAPTVVDRVLGAGPARPARAIRIDDSIDIALRSLFSA